MLKHFWLYFLSVYTISDGFIRPVLVHSTADVTSTCRLQDATNCGFEEQNLHSFYSKHCVLLPNSSGHTHCRMLKVRTYSIFFLKYTTTSGVFLFRNQFFTIWYAIYTQGTSTTRLRFYWSSCTTSWITWMGSWLKLTARCSGRLTILCWADSWTHSVTRLLE